MLGGGGERERSGEWEEGNKEHFNCTQSIIHGKISLSSVIVALFGHSYATATAHHSGHDPPCILVTCNNPNVQITLICTIVD